MEGSARSTQTFQYITFPLHFASCRTWKDMSADYAGQTPMLTSAHSNALCAFFITVNLTI
jgi:hypothetical protein